MAEQPPARSASTTSGERRGDRVRGAQGAAGSDLGCGPFEKVAGTIHDMHDDLVVRLAPRPGERWLDLGCGTGEVAFRAACAGAVLSGSDLAPGMIETARHSLRQLAGEEALELTLEVADCAQLPYADVSLDVGSPSVGVIFAPDQPRVASEPAPVCRPGGRLDLTVRRGSSGVGEMLRELFERSRTTTGIVMERLYIVALGTRRGQPDA